MLLQYSLDHNVAGYIQKCLDGITIPGKLAEAHSQAKAAIGNPTNKEEYEQFVKDEIAKEEANKEPEKKPKKKDA